MRRLADRYTVVVPDLRGFGDSDKPYGPFGPEGHAADMLALIEALGIERIGVVGHDVGGAAMPHLARKAPERLANRDLVSEAVKLSVLAGVARCAGRLGSAISGRLT
jgi:pimeloyl-ACP methyl ester carboxylesterase